MNQQTFLVLEGSKEVVHQKIKGDSHLKKKKLNYTLETGQERQNNKVVLIKFKENVTPQKVEELFPNQIVWDVDPKRKERCAKILNRIAEEEQLETKKKEEHNLENLLKKYQRLLETGIPPEQIIKFNEHLQKASKPKLDKHLSLAKLNIAKNIDYCMKHCQTSAQKIQDYADSHQKSLISDILGKRRRSFDNKLNFCIESYCQNFNTMDIEELIKKKIKKYKLVL